MTENQEKLKKTPPEETIEQPKEETEEERLKREKLEEEQGENEFKNRLYQRFQNLPFNYNLDDKTDFRYYFDIENKKRHTGNELNACIQPELNNPMKFTCEKVKNVKPQLFKFPHIIRLGIRDQTFENFCQKQCVNEEMVMYLIEEFSQKSIVRFWTFLLFEEENYDKKYILENLILAQLNTIVHKILSVDINDRVKREIYKIMLGNLIYVNPLSEIGTYTLIVKVLDALPGFISLNERNNIKGLAKYISGKVKSKVNNLKEIITFALSSLSINRNPLKQNKNKFVTIIGNLRHFFQYYKQGREKIELKIKENELLLKKQHSILAQEKTNDLIKNQIETYCRSLFKNLVGEEAYNEYNKDSTFDQIYRKITRLYHPDKNKNLSEEKIELFKTKLGNCSRNEINKRIASEEKRNAETTYYL